MSNKWLATLLFENLSYQEPPGLSNLTFGKPFANGIRIAEIEYLISSRVSKYYGDLVNFRFYNNLKELDIGAYTGTDILTWKKGYLYKFNYVDRTFKVYDDHGTLIRNFSNVNSFADMKIDFTIHKTHQFEIYLESEGGKAKLPFLIPAKFKMADFDFEIMNLPQGVGELFPKKFINPYKLRYMVDSFNVYAWAEYLERKEVTPDNPLKPNDIVYNYNPFGFKSPTTATNHYQFPQKPLPHNWFYVDYDIYREAIFYKKVVKPKVGYGVVFIRHDYVLTSGGGINGNSLLTQDGNSWVLNSKEEPTKNYTARIELNGKDVNILISAPNNYSYANINIDTSKNIEFYEPIQKQMDGKKEYVHIIVQDGLAEIQIDNMYIGIRYSFTEKPIDPNLPPDKKKEEEKRRGEEKKKEKPPIIINNEEHIYKCGFNDPNPLKVKVESRNLIRYYTQGAKYKKGEVIAYKDNYYLAIEDFEEDILATSKVQKICQLVIPTPISHKAQPIYWDWTLPEWAHGLYPKLNKVVRDGELQNNRPIYEPWLIWDGFIFVSRFTTDNYDKYPIDILDLSPNWA